MLLINREFEWALSSSVPTPTHPHSPPLIPTHPPHTPEIFMHPPPPTQNNAPVTPFPHPPKIMSHLPHSSLSTQNNVPYTLTHTHPTHKIMSHPLKINHTHSK